MQFDTPAQEVAAKVRAELAYQKRSQRDLVTLLHRSQPAVSRRLMGDVPFDIDELFKIAELLGKPLSNFVSSVSAICPEHRPVQHRDGKSPWCEKCGLTAEYSAPVSKLDVSA